MHHVEFELPVSSHQLEHVMRLVSSSKHPPRSLSWVLYLSLLGSVFCRLKLLFFLVLFPWSGAGVAHDTFSFSLPLSLSS